MISFAELDEIEKRASKATPGPWRVTVDGRMPFDGQEGVLAYIGDDGGEGPTVHVACNMGTPGMEAADVMDDAEFIAASREDVVRLVRFIRWSGNAQVFIRLRELATELRCTSGCPPLDLDKPAPDFCAVCRIRGGLGVKA